MSDQSLSLLAEKAGQAAALLKSLSNERRLLILCHLISAGEMSVGALVGAIGLSQSALSQHLARLRGDGLVTFRREAQTLHYRIANPDTGRVIAVLRDIYCPELEAGAPDQAAEESGMRYLKIPLDTL
jgi:ArsR family transcriptional regulator, virulence genes transcriptional regulator